MPWDFGVSDVAQLTTAETGTGKVLAPDGSGGLVWVTPVYGATDHGALTGVTANQHHNQAHVLTGGDHTASGLTIGHFLKATGATTFGFAAHGLTYTDVGAADSAHTHAFSDHGALTGIADDDHTQYLLATGTRAGATSQAQKFGMSTANTATVQQILTVGANSTGTAAAGFGSRILWELESDTTDDQTAAYLDVQWNAATHATPKGRMTFWANDAGTMRTFLHNFNDSRNTGMNIFIGLGAGNQTLGGASAADGSYNAFIGAEAGKSLTTGYNNVAIGYQSFYVATNAQGNVVIGSKAGYSTTTKTNGNALIGFQAGYSLTGYAFALAASKNTAIGSNALYSNVTGVSSVAIGNQAGAYETGTFKLFIDGVDRTNEANGRIQSLIYGEFSTTLASQLLRINGVNEILMTDAATNAATTTHKMRHNTTGTVAAGFGTKQQWYLESSTTDDRDAAAITTTWATATDASRAARMTFSVYDTAAREALRLEASGTAAMIGFLGGAAVVRQTGFAVPTDLATCITALTAVRTLLINYNLSTTV